MGHLLTAAADHCRATGKTSLLDVARKCADFLDRNDISGRKMYVTGGTGAWRHGLSTRGDRVHEAYGAAFELPRRTAYNETCANVAHAMFSRRLLALSGNARHADVMELGPYDAMLAGISLDGTRFFTPTPSNAGPASRCTATSPRNAGMHGRASAARPASPARSPDSANGRGAGPTTASGSTCSAAPRRASTCRLASCDSNSGPTTPGTAA